MKPKSTNCKIVPLYSPQKKIRVRAVWRDWCAGFVFVLEEYTPPRKILFWKTKGYWSKRTEETRCKLRANDWCAHYRVEIEWENAA